MNIDYFKKHFPETVELLQFAKKNNRISHAYLIYCDNPETRKNFAEFLASLILCSEKNIKNIPCGVCENCTKMEKGVYPDLYSLEPSSKSRRIVIGGGSDDVDTIRWFQSRFSLSTISSSGKKIGIIYDADRIMPQAQNAFLKTLEEPPRGSFFILATANPKSLLPTVISRCQPISVLSNQIEYSFQGNEDLFDLLARIITSDKSSISFADTVSEMLLKIFNDLRLEANEKTTSKWNKKLEQAENLDSASTKKQIQERYKAAIEAEYLLLREVFLSAIHSWFAQLFQLSNGIGYDLLSNPEILPEKIRDINLDTDTTQKYLQYTERLIGMLKWNVDEKLAIQEFCFNLILK